MTNQGARAVRDAIARREEIGEDGLRRALVAHGQWLVAASATEPLGVDGATAQLAYFGDEACLPAGELWVFTDAGAAREARDGGASLGHYVADIHGQDLFGVIAPEYQRVRVNPLGDSEACSFAGDALGWLHTAALEHSTETALASAAEHLLASTARRLREHSRFIALRTADGRLLARPRAEGDSERYVLAFSAEDCLKAFVALLAPECAAELEIVRMGGRDLFGEVARSELAGILFNPDGPGPTTALSRDVARTLSM